MSYRNYIKELLSEALVPKIKQSLKQKWKLEVPTLTEPQMDHYIEAFEKYKNDSRIVQKDITKYSFHELESVIDSNFIIKKPQSEISAEPIYQKGTLTVYESQDKDQCIKIGRGEKWCISRSDASNMYNSYRYNRGEPNFYFIEDSSKPDTDKWSFFVLMPFKDGTFGLASRANSSPFTGSEEYSWDEVVRNAPALKPLKGLFKSKPLTDEERRIYELIKNKVEEPDLLKHFKKLSLVDQYIGFGHKLTKKQFENLNNKELRMKYINTGKRIESLDSLSQTEINRYLKTNMELENGNLYLSSLTSLQPNTKFPETIEGDLDLYNLTSLPPNTKFPNTIKGDLSLISLTSLPPNFKFPETIEGDLDLYNLTSLPPNTKFPNTIKGDLSLYNLTSLPIEVWNSMADQVKSKVPGRLRPKQ